MFLFEQNSWHLFIYLFIYLFLFTDNKVGRVTQFFSTFEKRCSYFFASFVSYWWKYVHLVRVHLVRNLNLSLSACTLSAESESKSALFTGDTSKGHFFTMTKPVQEQCE